MDLDIASSLPEQAHETVWEDVVRRFSPRTSREVAALLHRAQESGLPLAFSPEEACLLEKPVWLDLRSLNTIRHDQPGDFIVRVEAGVTFGALDAALAPFNQAFPLSYPADATVDEVLAEDRPAPETGLRGYPRDYVLKTEIATPDGRLTVSGADVVKNVTGYDLHKFYVGGRNAFGVITSATLKVLARPAEPVRLDTLSGWPPEVVVAEAVLPLGACAAFTEAVADSVNRAGWRLQTVPTAGLAHLISPSWPAVNEQAKLTDALDRLQTFLEGLRVEAKRCEGFLQIVHMPFSVFSSDRPGGAQAIERLPALLETFNLPEDASTRRLLQALKGSYDPKGVLFTPYCPLKPMTPLVGTSQT
jgi:FAD/FMN-containing dehydrogenase